jgi:hypothetical protein
MLIATHIAKAFTTKSRQTKEGKKRFFLFLLAIRFQFVQTGTLRQSVGGFLLGRDKMKKEFLGQKTWKIEFSSQHSVSFIRKYKFQ